MKEKSIKVSRKFRSTAEIFGLLEAHHQSGQSVKSFCASHNIAPGIFHNWKHKYGKIDLVSDVCSFYSGKIERIYVSRGSQ